MTKNKYFQAFCGIACPALVWCLPVLLSGLVLGGDRLDLGYSNLKLGIIYLLLFPAYCVLSAIYAKRNNLRVFYVFSSVVLALPILCFLLSYLSVLAGLDYGTALLGFFYKLATPAGNATLMFPDSVALTVISQIIIPVSLVSGFVTYKVAK